MILNKNGFYKLSEIQESKIEINDWLDVCIFDDTEKNIDIEVWKNSKLKYFAFYDNSWDFSKNIVSKKDNSDIIINTLYLVKDIKLRSKIYWWIFANNCKMYLNLLSFAMSNWDLEVDGIFEIWKSLDNNKWFLDEENIFIWDNAKIKALPKLFVESNDIEAGHACKMERISDEKLFYLRSRWVEKKNALTIMVEAKIKSLFSNLEIIDKSFYDNFIEQTLEKIK